MSTNNEIPIKDYPAYILKLMSVPKIKNVYVLGCFAKRVTLYSQQVRALNLIYALNERKIIKENSKLLIIGAGVAGMTAAAAAAHLKCNVEILEQFDEPLSTIRGNTKRHIHPYILEWPDKKALESDAKLEILNWKADYADSVADQISKEWERVWLPTGRIKFIQNVNSIIFEPKSPLEIDWTTTDKGTRSSYPDVMILSVGFGLEEAKFGLPARSYWDDDNIHKPSKIIEKPKKILISGIGDGGIIDLLRSSFTGFKHHEIVEEILFNNNLDKLKSDLLKIERELILIPNSDIRAIHNAYENLELPATLCDLLKKKLRKDTSVYLNGEHRYRYNPNASILNRFLLRILIKIGKVNYKAGKIKEVLQEGTRYKVFFDDKEEIFDEVIIRHGPSSALKKDFPKIFELCKEKFEALYQEADYTFIRMYKSALFKNATRAYKNKKNGSDDRSSALKRPLDKLQLFERINKANETLNQFVATLFHWQPDKTKLFYADLEEKRISCTVSAIVLLALNDLGHREPHFICDQLLSARTSVLGKKTVLIDGKEVPETFKVWPGSQAHTEPFHIFSTNWALFSCLHIRPSCVGDLNDSVKWLIEQRPETEPGKRSKGWGHTAEYLPNPYYTTYALNALIEYYICLKVSGKKVDAEINTAILEGVQFLEETRIKNNDLYLWQELNNAKSIVICIATSIMSLHIIEKYHKFINPNSGRINDLNTVRETIGFFSKVITKIDKGNFVQEMVGNQKYIIRTRPKFTEAGYPHEYFVPNLALHLMELLRALKIDTESCLDPVVMSLIDQILIDKAEMAESGNKIYYLPNQSQVARPIWSTALGAYVLRTWLSDVKNVLLNSWRYFFESEEGTS